MAKHNKAAVSENMLPIQNCELCLVHVTPADEEPKIRARPLCDEVAASQGTITLYSILRYVLGSYIFRKTQFTHIYTCLEFLGPASCSFSFHSQGLLCPRR